MMLRAIAVSVLLVGCSSGGGVRPPPVPQLSPAVLTWSPTVDTIDGQPVSDIDGYVVRYGQGELASTLFVPGNATSTTLTLPAGTWAFEVRASSATFGLSPPSNRVEKNLP